MPETMPASNPDPDMPRKNHRTTCWDEPCLPAVLSRNLKRHLAFAQDLLDAIPDDWSRVRAFVVIGHQGDRVCRVDSTREGDEKPTTECVQSVYEAICDLGANALVPEGIEWVGIWVDYDIDGDRLTTTITHGGPKASILPAPSPTDVPKLPRCLLRRMVPDAPDGP